MDGIDDMKNTLDEVREQNKRLVEEMNILAAQNAEITDQNRKILAQVCNLTVEIRAERLHQNDRVEQIRGGLFSLSRRVLRVEEKVACGG